MLKKHWTSFLPERDLSTAAHAMFSGVEIEKLRQQAAVITADADLREKAVRDFALKNWTKGEVVMAMGTAALGGE